MEFSFFIFDQVLPNLLNYIIIVFISAIVVFFLYRFFMYSIYEIGLMWIVIFGVIFSLSNCIFLYQRNFIEQKYLINYIATTGIFYLVIIFFHWSLDIKNFYKTRAVKKKKEDIDNSQEIYGFAFLIFWIILNVLKILIFGIRSNEKIGGGTGLILRLLWLVTPILTHTILYMLFYRKWKKTALIYFILTFLFGIFSISRGAMITVIFGVLTFIFLNPTCRTAKRYIKKYGVILICIGIVFGILLVSIMNDSTYFDSALTIAYRFIAFGDVYPFIYVNQVADKISSTIDVSFFDFMLSSVMPMYRLASHEDFSDTNLIGLIVDEVRGPGSKTGPNMRFNVAGYIFWGESASILFAIFCAIIFCVVHILVVKSINMNYKIQMVAVLLASSLISLEQDVSLVPTFLGNIPLFLLIFSYLEIVILGAKAFKVDYNISHNFKK